MRVVFLEWAYFSCWQRFGSRPRSQAEVLREFFDILLPLAGIHLHRLDTLCIYGSRILFGAVALDPFRFGVHATRLLHLPHTSVRSQFGFGASLQLTVESLVM